MSDLHFSVSEKFGFNIDNAENLVDMLLRDISAQNFCVDTIFITGDISFSGQKEELDSVHDRFLAPLIEKLNLSFSDLYIVPGNHDMDRSKVSTSESLLRKNCTAEDLETVFTSINNNKEAWNRTDNYREFEAQLKKHQDNIIFDTPLITIRDSGKNLRIHCINSAWLAVDDNDNGNLRVLPCIKESIENHGKNKKNIILMHHPINWMSKDEINSVSRIIEKKVDAVFYGHMHEFEQSVTINFSNDITLKLQAGTIDTRSDNSGYSFISLDSNDSFEYGKIYYRKLDKDNQIYKAWTERIENGFSDFSIDKRCIFDSAKFCEKSGDLIEEIEFSHLVNIGKNTDKKLKLSQIFIEPKISEDRAIEKSMPDIGKIKNFTDLQSAHGCILISATEQQGRTTLLKKLQLEYLTDQSNYNLSHIVFYIDLSFNFSTSHKILNHFISNYEDSDLQTSFSGKLKSCISDGNAVFLVDNYDRCSAETLKSINEFIEKYSSNKFIITGEIENNTNNLTKLISAYSGLVYNAALSNIARCDIRQIISRRPINSPLHSDDELFQNLTKLVDNSQLPHNHFVYSILLLIYEEKHKLVGILNEADIIENYIEILLEKHCMNASKSTPEYKVLLHFLGFVCSKLLTTKRAFLSDKEMHKYIIEFEELTFNEFPIQSYINPVIDSGIIISRSNSSYEFSNNCFLYFFSAYYMNVNEDLKSYVFEDDNYKDLDKVIEYYASINSTNFDVLDFFENKVKKSREDLKEEVYKTHNINLESLKIDEIPTISLLDFASSSDEFESSIDELEIDHQKYDAVLDKNVPLRGGKNTSSSKIQEKEEVNDENSSELLSKITNYRRELSIFSKVFRNTELVMNPTEVMRMFDLIIDSYVFMIKSDIASLNESTVLPLLLPKFEEKTSGQEITLDEKSEILEKFKVILSVIRAFVPNTVEQLLSNNLSTKKPRFTKILNNKLSSTKESDIEELLIRFLLLDIERGNFKSHISELYKLQGKVTSSALFLKLLQLTYTRHDFKLDEKTFLQNTLKDLVKNNRSVNKEELKKLSLVYED